MSISGLNLNTNYYIQGDVIELNPKTAVQNIMRIQLAVVILLPYLSTTHLDSVRVHVHYSFSLDHNVYMYGDGLCCTYALHSL